MLCPCTQLDLLSNSLCQESFPKHLWQRQQKNGHPATIDTGIHKSSTRTPEDATNVGRGLLHHRLTKPRIIDARPLLLVGTMFRSVCWTRSSTLVNIRLTYKGTRWKQQSSYCEVNRKNCL